MLLIDDADYPRYYTSAYPASLTGSGGNPLYVVLSHGARPLYYSKAGGLMQSELHKTEQSLGKSRRRRRIAVVPSHYIEALRTYHATNR